MSSKNDSSRPDAAAEDPGLADGKDSVEPDAEHLTGEAQAAHNAATESPS